MPEKNTTDLIMMFTLNNQAVSAECQLVLASNDGLTTGFQSASSSRKQSNFFEINDFDFGVKLKDSDKSPGVQSTQPTSGQGAQMQPKRESNYVRWRSAKDPQYKDIAYPAEFEKFGFSRTMDAASPVFFDACCNSKTFDSAVLVKRISQGGDKPSMGYLRIDFTRVLVTSVGWDDGELVKEKLEFICQAMKITYKAQDHDGTVGVSTSEALWPNPKNDRTRGVRGGGG